MSDDLVKRPGAEFCPHSPDSPYYDAWLDGFAASTLHWLNKRIAALRARNEGEGA